MLIVPPPKFRKNRRPPEQEAVVPSPPPPVPLVLAAASCDDAIDYVVLGFDRSIDVSGLDPSTILVSDGDTTSASYTGNGETEMVDDATVKIYLQESGGPLGPGVVLVAPADTGIVAVDDGGTWEGATDLNLPFGG